MLIIVVLLLLGILAWSMVGTLETRADVKVSVKDHRAQVIALDSSTLSEGMSFSVSGQEYKIAAAEKDEYGRSVGVAEVSLPDGIYDGSAVIERVRTISFLIENK